MMRFKYFSLIAISTVALFGLVTFPFLEYSNYDGDLTRMAMLPEKDFGWQSRQPKFDNNLLVSSSWAEADVLVIGDSFSEKLLWQSKLVEAGYRVRTESWSSIGLICDDFNKWLSAKMFQGRYVIIQSVENSFDARLKKSNQCSKTQYKSLKKKEVTPPPEVIDRGLPAPNNGQLYAGMKTWINQRLYEKKSHDPSFKVWYVNENVKIERVENGCQLFSHARCHDVLFYRKISTPQIDHLRENIKKINQKVSPRELIWLIIPDKSSVYLNDDSFLLEFNTIVHQSIDVLRPLRQAVDDKQIDLYFGNDTHLSPKGYLLIGNVVRDYLSKH